MSSENTRLRIRIAELEKIVKRRTELSGDFSSFINNSPDIFYRTDTRGNITCVSPSIKRVTGYTVEEAVDLNMAQDLYLIAEEWELFLKRLSVTGTLDNFTVRLKHKNGETRWASVSASYQRNTADEVIGVEGSIRDVTAQMRTDLEARRIIEMSLDMICIADIETARFIKVNAAFTRTLGFTETELLGISFIELVHPEDQSATLSILEEKLKKGEQVIKFKNRFRCKDGAYRWLSWLSHPEPETGLTYAIARDVTEEIETAEALQESEKRFRNIIESSPMGIFLYELMPDDRLVLTGANKAADQVLGIKIGDLVGLTLEEAFPPLRQTEIPDAYRAVCKEGVVWSTEQVTYHDERISGAFEVHAFQTSPMKAAIFFLDITGKKIDAQEKQLLQKQLQQAQKMEAIGTLAGGIAHDFNNILMAIQGRVSLALTEVSANSPAHEHLTSTEHYIQDASDLTRQLLGFARGGKYEISPISINDLVSASADMFGRTKKEIRLHKNLSPKAWNIEGDRQQLQQVMLNLYVNAWQAMAEGGDLYLETENISIEADQAAALGLSAGSYVRLSVQDTGVGIPAETMPKIFEPFFTTREKMRGTGLGLASVYGIIKNHNGAITVHSEPGRGTTFEILLPATSKEVLKRRQPVSQSAAGSETVLLVDDEAIVLEVGAEMLKNLGYTVLTAANGAEAVELYRKKSAEIDLVVLDMIMPDMDGKMTYNALAGINPHVKVLLSSGYSLDGKASEMLKKGCMGFIQKPFSLKAISTKLRSILDRQRDTANLL